MPLIGELVNLEQKIGIKAFSKKFKPTTTKIENKSDKQNAKIKSEIDQSNLRNDFANKDELDQNLKSDTRGVPIERSSKRIPSKNFLNDKLNKSKMPIRDPRFSDKFGTLKRSRFEKTYNFIHDIEDEELKNLSKEQFKIAKKRRKFGHQCSEHEHKLIQTIRSKKQRISSRKEKLKASTDQKIQKRDKIKQVKDGKGVYFEKKNIQKRQNFKRKNMPDEFRRSSGKKKISD